MFILVFFFFKQNTAYEMRISDWSSDVCSSDLAEHQQSSASALFYLCPLPTASRRAWVRRILSQYWQHRRAECPTCRCDRSWQVPCLQNWSGPCDARRHGNAASDGGIPDPRSDARRVGKEVVSTCTYRW